MQFFDLDRYGKEWITAFKADFFRDYVVKQSIIDVPSSDVISPEEIEKFKSMGKAISYYTCNGKMNDWQNNFATLFAEKYKEIEADLKSFLMADEEINQQLVEKKSSIEDVIHFKNISVYSNEADGIDFTFASCLHMHTDYFFTLKWYTNGSVSHTKI